MSLYQPQVRNVAFEWDLDLQQVGEIAHVACDVDGVRVELKVVRREDGQVAFLFAPGGADLSEGARLAVEQAIGRIVEFLSRNLRGGAP